MYAASWRMFRPDAKRLDLTESGLRPGAVEPKTDMLVRMGCSGAATIVSFDASRVGHIAAHGIIVGALIGMAGVGGGFLIVPVLVLLSGLSMKQAVGTSLVIVSAKSFAGHMGTITIAVAGSFLGAAVSKQMLAEGLKKAFAVFLVLVATYIVIHETMGG